VMSVTAARVAFDIIFFIRVPWVKGKTNAGGYPSSWLNFLSSHLLIGSLD
jgi:hypothetical protein